MGPQGFRLVLEPQSHWRKPLLLSIRRPRSLREPIWRWLIGGSRQRTVKNRILSCLQKEMKWKDFSGDILRNPERLFDISSFVNTTDITETPQSSGRLSIGLKLIDESLHQTTSGVFPWRYFTFLFTSCKKTRLISGPLPTGKKSGGVWVLSIKEVGVSLYPRPYTRTSLYPQQTKLYKICKIPIPYICLLVILSACLLVSRSVCYLESVFLLLCVRMLLTTNSPQWRSLAEEIRTSSIRTIIFTRSFNCKSDGLIDGWSHRSVTRNRSKLLVSFLRNGTTSWLRLRKGPLISAFLVTIAQLVEKFLEVH